MDNKSLMLKAIAARESAYAPYSKYRVGAALLTKSGKVYTGCNIENASFTPSICAERVAFSKAVSEGEKDFAKIAIVGGFNEITVTCTPCGVCRQVMTEFCKPEFEIILGTPEDIRVHTLNELFPLQFVDMTPQ